MTNYHFYDRYGVALEVGDTTVLSRPEGTSSSRLDVVRVVRFHTASNRVTVEDESGYQFVTKFNSEKFLKLPATVPTDGEQNESSS